MEEAKKDPTQKPGPRDGVLLDAPVVVCVVEVKGGGRKGWGLGHVCEMVGTSKLL